MAGLIAPEERRDLHIIREIRNDFSHPSDLDISFETPRVRHLCDSLRHLPAVIEMPKDIGASGARCFRYPRSPGRKLSGVGQWHPTTVHSILVNEGYSGRVFYNKRIGKRQVKRPKKEWVAIAIPPMISVDVFHAA
jgi:Recombinase